MGVKKNGCQVVGCFHLPRHPKLIYKLKGIKGFVQSNCKRSEVSELKTTGTMFLRTIS